MNRGVTVGRWLVLLAGAGLFAWYASAQLIYSFYGPYQILRLLFPQWFPPITTL